MFLAVYFLLRSYTSTVGYFETVPPFVPATLVSIQTFFFNFILANHEKSQTQKFQALNLILQPISSMKKYRRHFFC